MISCFTTTVSEVSYSQIGECKEFEILRGKSVAKIFPFTPLITDHERVTGGCIAHCHIYAVKSRVDGVSFCESSGSDVAVLT